MNTETTPRSEPGAPAAATAERAAATRDARRLRTVRLRRVLYVLLGLLALAALIVIWSPDPIAVDIGEAARGPLQVTVDEDGVTRVKDRYVVSAPLLGNLARIELDAGDRVAPGAVVARLLPLAPPLLDARTRAQAQARVAAATAARRQSHAGVERTRAALDFARRESERQRGLTRTGAVEARAVERAELEERTLTEDLASAEFGARVADYELQVAQATLGRLDAPQPHSGEQAEVEVTSPVGGRVLRVIQRNEGAVQTGTPLLEIGDPAALEIVVDVLTVDAVHIENGAPVSIERWGGSQTLRAHVRLIEPSAFTRTSALGVDEQRVNVVIDLDEPHAVWAALGDGYRVEARIQVFRQEDVLTVPASALFRRGDQWAVFAVEDEHARVRTVEVGEQNGARARITRGLAKGQRIVVYPSDRISDGARVQAR